MLGVEYFVFSVAKNLRPPPFECRNRFATPPLKVEKNLRPPYYQKKMCLICPVILFKTELNAF